jgi:DNA-binding SARP family transcriptional activator
MPAIGVILFGKFCVQDNEHVLCGKAQELFSYLLIHRNRPHPRETLAGLLWSDCVTSQSKKYLRQALWQLQAALEPQTTSACDRLLLVHTNHIQINSDSGLRLDVAVFEDAFDAVQGVDERHLCPEKARMLEEAIQLYRGDLLEGWYQDWCLYERERLQNVYLSMLDKMMGYCEANGLAEKGLTYGDRILAQDRARERTHRRQMRLRYLAGDRTGALRQYERCVAALQEELAVKPSAITVELYEQIRADSLDLNSSPPPAPNNNSFSVATHLPQMLGRFKQLQAAISDLQRQVQQGIKAVEAVLGEGESNKVEEPGRIS